MNKLISAIIVTYNSEDFIEDCIESVLKFLPETSEVIIFDNASTDQTVKRIEKFLPAVKLVKSSKNLGFGAGNNLAIKDACGEYLFFLNPDTQLLSPVDKMINFCKKNLNVGIVGPKLILPNGQTQPSVRKLPTIWGAIKEFILAVKNSYSQYIPEGEDSVEVECLYGAAILIKKDLFKSLGGFDKKYFLYYEDIDLCKRVKSLGKKIYYYPQVKIKHLVGATKSSQDRNLLNLQSAKIYHGIVTTFLLQTIFKLHNFLKKIK